MIRIRIIWKRDPEGGSERYQGGYMVEENHDEQPSSEKTGWRRVAGTSEFPTAVTAALALLEIVEENFSD